MTSLSFIKRGKTAHAVTQSVQQALVAAGGAAFRAYVEAKEEAREVVMVGGEPFRFKYKS